MSGTYSAVDNLDAMREARNYNAFLVREVLRARGEARTCLDFGAGTGTFAEALRERGVECLCVEPDAALCRDLQARGFASHTDLAGIPPESVDFIFTLNVLEHIEDDVGCLKALRTVLRPGGSLYVYVPAFNVLFSSMDRKVGHYRRYTREMLHPRLEAAGFVIERSRYADSLGFGASLAYKWFGNSRGDLNPAGLVLYDRWLLPVSLALDTVTSGFLGKNLAVLARRKG